MLKFTENSVSERKYKNLGFDSKKEAIDFANSEKITIQKRDSEKTFLSRLDFAWKNKRDYEYVQSLRKQVTDELQRNRNESKTGLYTLENNTNYEYNGKEYTLNLTSDLAADLISLTTKPSKGMFQIITLQYTDTNGEIKEIFKTRNAQLIDGLRNAKNAGANDYVEVVNNFENLISITIQNRKTTSRNKRAEGGFFPYHVRQDSEKYENLIDIKEKLKRYQVFYSDSEQSIDNCFVYSLMMWGECTNIELQNLKLKIKGNPDAVPKKVLKQFAEDNNILITVRSLRKNSDVTDTITYGDKDNSKRKVKIGLLENHYFLIEDVNVSKYAIENYRKVRKTEEWWSVTNEKLKKNKNCKTSSFCLIKTLINNRLVLPITTTQSSLSLTNRCNIDETIVLDNTVESEKYKEYEVNKFKRLNSTLEGKIWKSIKKETEERPISVKIAFDFETTTNGEQHEPYMVCYAIYVNNERIGDTDKRDGIRTITGNNCAESFLNDMNNECNSIVRNYLKNKHKIELDQKSKDYFKAKSNFFSFTLMAHNITYDMNFLVKHVKNYNPITRAGSNVCGGSFNYGGTRFNLKDTLAIITFGLAKFKDIFKLDDSQGKEILPYDLYTTATVDEYTQPIKKALDLIKEEDHEQFLKNLKEWNLIQNKTEFDHIKYAEIYCKRDVDVMMRGYMIFREWVLGKPDDEDSMGIDIDDKLTISSISDEFFAKEGCYKDCYKINGIARYFIQKTVIGGRCMSAENLMYTINKKKHELNDFDAVSLYPSAMKRLAEMGGYLKGKPKVIEEENLNLDFLNEQSGYFIEVKLLKIPKHRKFPLISFINEKGVREFTNELTKCDTFHFNKIGFEDLIKYHELKERHYKIIKGYYFDEGRNKKIGKSINKVFQMRLDMKSKKNPAETLYKLIMNSSYGKTIMKEQSTKTIYKNSKQEFLEYISINYNHVREAIKIKGCDKYLITVNKPISDHYNACHIGSEILSMSKRIMNEVMTLAEDNDIDIYYQDTDSMHIVSRKVEKLANLFKEQYDRDLIGKAMGQFHCDFEPYQGRDAIHATKTVILGKKTYYDKVYYGDGIYHDHFRMKGIPQPVVIKKAKELAKQKREPDDDRSDVEFMYDYMYDGHSIVFDLLSCGVKFKKSKDATISNALTFTRTLSFTPENGELDDVIDI